MSDCNNCAVSDCSEAMIKKMKSNCVAYIRPEKMKTSLLVHLMADDRKAKACTELLSRFNLKIREWGRYPGFKLEVKK